jgi:hypothetical protein
VCPFRYTLNLESFRLSNKAATGNATKSPGVENIECE